MSDLSPNVAKASIDISCTQGAPGLQALFGALYWKHRTAERSECQQGLGRSEAVETLAAIPCSFYMRINGRRFCHATDLWLLVLGEVDAKLYISGFSEKYRVACLRRELMTLHSEPDQHKIT